jgi:sugar phosphate isomerase/epimerase
MDAALERLLALRPDGVQLTPGNMPTPGFAARVEALRTRTHHGFSFTHWKRAVWNDDGSCAVTSDSVHPPRATHAAAARFLEAERLPVLETMYPGYALGSGPELELAMQRGLSLAVDVSHVYLQQTAGLLGEATWRRLQDYPHIAEVHVSRNGGHRDAHLPLTAGTFGLGWALARLRAGTPVIFEAYFHRLSPEAQQAQVALFDEVRP